MNKKKAIFLDRDGVINSIVYNSEFGIMHSPILPSQVTFIDGIFDFLHAAQKKEYKLIVISNQPNIGIGKMSMMQFKSVTKKITRDLKKEGISLDGEYYCFHHPFATIKKYKILCHCRKPKTGLIERAIQDFDIDLNNSFVIGDGIFDIIAGNTMNIPTILLANINQSDYLHILEQEMGNNKPNFLVKTLRGALKII